MPEPDAVIRLQAARLARMWIRNTNAPERLLAPMQAKLAITIRDLGPAWAELMVGLIGETVAKLAGETLKNNFS